VLTPGSTTWPEAVGAFLVGMALLFVPGTVAGLLARLRPLSAMALGPVLSTTCLAVAGIVAPVLGLRWGVAPLGAGVLCLWVGAYAVGAAQGRLGRRVPWLGSPGRLGAEPPAGETSVTPAVGRSRRSRTLGRPGRWSRLVAWADTTSVATVAGVAVAFVAVGYTLVRVSGTPEAFPQHPDTIFHLADAQWFIERGDISSLTANGYITTSHTGFYPAAFHGFTATIAEWSGVPVVVATSVFVLAIAGVVWPLGCITLAQTLLGRRTPVVLAAALASVAFTGFPYFLMGFGVLWPNLFGETLLPAYLAALVAVVGSRARPPLDVAPRLTAAALLVVGAPGLGLAHPNAVMSFGVFAVIYLVGIALGAAWARRDRPLRLLATVIAVAASLAVIYAGATWVRPDAMLQTGAIGPELPVHDALRDLLCLAPRGAAYLPILSVVLAIGVVALLVRHRGARWLVAATAVMYGLYWVNVTVDTEFLRNFTWPWYNNAVRLQAVGVLPAALTAAAGLVGVSDLLARLARRLTGRHLVASAAVLTVFVLTSHLYLGAHGQILHRYFHPKSANSWASPSELRSLHALSAAIPDDAVVAANPWNGGTYLYVVSGRHLLIPTEKANTPGDRELLSLKLDQVGTDRDACAAATRQHVEWAITGGRPFSWVGNRMKEYVGIDGVGRSPAWEKVEQVGHYTLYHRIDCYA